MLVITYIVILLTGLTMATVMDIRQRRIPNSLTVSITIIGLIHNLIIHGWGGLLESVLAMFFGLVIFFIFYLMGIFGAGDAKLMAALGALMGFPFIIYTTLTAIIVGGCLSFIQLVRKEGLKQVLFFIYFFTKALFTGKLKEFNQMINSTSTNTFPFSIAITAGSVITLWYMYLH